MNHQYCARRAGFSLIELLIALTILAIALVPVAYFYSKSLQAAEEASIRTRALMLANERLAELRQMPYDQIRTNITPSNTQKIILSDTGVLDQAATGANDNWTGYDYATSGRSFQFLLDASGYPNAPPGLNNNRGQFPEHRGMFFYALPLYFNPYMPGTQGYFNAEGINHYQPNTLAGVSDSHMNIWQAGGATSHYEYEPVGFYAVKVRRRNESLAPADQGFIGLQDRRTIAGVEPALSGSGVSMRDPYRHGTSDEVEKYSLYGRRTIILDALPMMAQISDTDTDGYAPWEDLDGGATALNPYTVGKGPDNKFQVPSRYGLGKLVIVQVFWLPRQAPAGYIPPQDLNIIELKTFITPSGEQESRLDRDSNVLLRNNFLFITPDAP